MESQSSSIDSSDRALQVSSGNLGDSLPEDNAILKRTNPASQESLDRAVDVENPAVGASLQLRQRKPQRRINELHNSYRTPKIARHGLPIFTKFELQSERYVNYRNNQNKPVKRGKVQVWTDELEEAFQDALRYITNKGRKRQPCNGREMGVNELISEFIFQRTGIRRDRKKVSSHIQVLKAFMNNNDAWMALVTPESKQEGVEHLSRTPLNKSENFGIVDGHHYPYFNALPPPPDILPSDRSTVRRINFEMYILGPELEKLHIYTSLQSEIGSASKRLDDIPDWQVRFPPVASYCDQGSLHGEIILFETSFKLMNNHPPIKIMGNQPPLRSKLGVDFDVDIDRGAEYMNWECHSNFYENGVLKESLGTPTKSESLLSGEARVVVLHLSQWWVDRFTNIIKERLQKEQEGDFHAVQQDDERARHQIRAITAVQEIWATPEASGSQRERMAIFLWNFRQCQNHEVPTTTWRKLIPPATTTEFYSPIQASAPPFLQPSMIIDTVPRHHESLQSTPLYAEYFNPLPVTTDESEESFGCIDSRLCSPSLGPVADSRSFPSSTSESYPSSVHSSAFHTQASQNSSYGSQDLMLYPEGNTYSLQEIGFNSIYPSQELERTPEVAPDLSSHEVLFCPHGSIESHESPRASQGHSYQLRDTMVHSQETEYSSSASQCQPGYPHHPTRNPNDPELSPTIQDFTSMHIQLSYEVPEEATSTYDPPYIAPLGNMGSSQENCIVGFEPHSQKAVPDLQEGQHQEPFDLEQWQAMDQAVQWANSQFSNGEYEEVGDLLKNNGSVVLEDIGDLQSGMDVDMGLQ